MSSQACSPHHSPILASKSLLCPRPGRRLGSQTGAWRGCPHTGGNSAAPSAGAGTQREGSSPLFRGGFLEMAEMKEQAGLHLHEQSSWGRSPELGPGHLQKSRKLNPRLLSRQKDQQTDRQMAGIGVAGQVRPRHEGCGGPWSKLEAVFPKITSPSK